MQFCQLHNLQSLPIHEHNLMLFTTQLSTYSSYSNIQFHLLYHLWVSFTASTSSTTLYADTRNKMQIMSVNLNADRPLYRFKPSTTTYTNPHTTLMTSLIQILPLVSDITCKVPQIFINIQISQTICPCFHTQTIISFIAKQKMPYCPPLHKMTTFIIFFSHQCRKLQQPQLGYTVG